MRAYPITIDDREKDPSPEEQLRGVQEAGGHAAIGRLAVGDYAWICEPDKPGEEWESWIGERKTIKDLIASMPPTSDRLTRFFENTGGFNRQPYVHRFVLVEGNQFAFAGYGQRQWSPEAIDNLLVGLQDLGIVVVRSRSGADTPQRLVSLWTRSARADRGTSILKPSLAAASDRFFNRADREAVALLMGLPSIGEDRAVAILKVYPTLEKVFLAALAGALVKVPGIGKMMQASIKTFLERQVDL